MARTCRTLSVLLNAGIPLIEAMETVSNVSGNSVIESALGDATQRMRDGGTIAETLRETGQFPGMITQLVATGEESGTLPTMLGKAAIYYEQQVDKAVATLSSLIEPIMIVIMGAIAGSVIFALYLPIFSLGQAMKRRPPVVGAHRHELSRDILPTASRSGSTSSSRCSWRCPPR